jgi:ABC-type sugar transport system ATPase subunit
MATLRLEHVQKAFGATRILEDVTLDVAHGEYIVLVGPSGCGKSTLLRCIAGLEDITGGALFIGDRSATHLAPRDRDVAMVFQSYALYPHLTVRENMGFALRIQGRPADEIARRVGVVAEMLELGALMDRKPAELSGGQRQRVAMGRAIVREPAVFLFDEPLSNLDPALRQHMRAELKRLHRRLGATIVHVTHDQIEALTLADRIVVLNGGAVQQVGTPRELYERPGNTFVARFIGAPAMNLLDVTGEGASSRLDGTDVVLPVSGDGPYRLGLRPTDLRPGGPLMVTVDLVESLGPEALVHVDLGGRELLVVVPEPCALRPGERVGLHLGAVHRFDRARGQRLPEPA